MEQGTGPENVQRRLAAILALDVAGYSRMMGADEEGTHARLSAVLRELVQPLIAAHGGRVVKKTGDGVLAEFASVVQATRCAVLVQDSMRKSGRDTPPGRQIQFRIGINLGDIIVEPDDIYGDGVNIAARLEGIAEPGGICVSQAVVEQVAGKLDSRFIDIGPRELKNIARPIHVFRVAGDAPDLPFVGSQARAPNAVPGFQGRPAIAVMPFANGGNDPEQEYFADGVTEDLIVALAAWRSFPVIARNSVFAYKGKDADPARLGRELGVRYIVEGTVRRLGPRLRITIRLIDTETQHNIFAERYDREVGDLFAVQEDIVQSLVGAIEPELLKRERERAVIAAPYSLTAYDLLQRGFWYHYRYTRDDNHKARELFRAALEADPAYAQAAASLAIALTQAVVSGWVERDAMLAEAFEIASKAASLDSRDPTARFALGFCLYTMARPEAAMPELREAIRLNPSYAVAHASLAFVHNYLNEPKTAIRFIETALRLSPHDPRHFMWLPALSAAHYLSNNYETAITVGQRALSIRPDYLVPVRYIAAGLGQLGRVADAGPVLDLLRKMDPDLAATERMLRRYYVSEEAIDHILGGLRRAGFQ
jgi:adenylate cyclase